MYDVLISGGTVVDGTKRERFNADVGIKNGKIAAIGQLPDAQGEKQIDATGKIVSPGFIDAHGHSEVSLLLNPTCESQVMQGITTEIAGHCGYSPFPISPHNRHMLIDPEGVDVDWKDIDGYFAKLKSIGTAINLVPQVGHLKIRAAAMQREDRPATGDETKWMMDQVREAMDYGVFGLSTGLDYAPATSADLEELVDLSSVVSKYDGVFSPHLRGYSRNVLNAVCEVLEVGRRTGAKVVVTHLGVAGRSQWGWMERVVELMDRARADGVNVICDLIPYPTSGVWWAPRAVLPDRVYSFKTPWSETAASLKQLISDAGERRRLRDEIEERRVRPKYGFHEEFAWLSDWANVKVMETAENSPHQAYVGLDMQQAAEAASLEPVDLFLNMLEVDGETLSLLHSPKSPNDFNMLVQYPHCAFSTDTIGTSIERSNEAFNALQSHPRHYGTMPRVLELFVRKQGLISLEQAIHRMCALPAEFYGLKQRGTLSEGNWADIVVFDAGTIGERATYRCTKAYPAGIDAVLVNGRITVQQGEHTGELAGQALLK